MAQASGKPPVEGSTGEEALMGRASVPNGGVEQDGYRSPEVCDHPDRKCYFDISRHK